MTPEIMRSSLTDKWYVVTKSRPVQNGNPAARIAQKKYDVTEQIAAIIAQAVAELAAAAAREASLREALKWYFRTRHHTRQHCPYRQSIGEWCSQCEREPSDMALLAEPDTTSGEEMTHDLSNYSL